MGHKVNPVSFRLGVIREWDSIWYADKKKYAKALHEDIAIRKFNTQSMKSLAKSLQKLPQ